MTNAVVKLAAVICTATASFGICAADLEWQVINRFPVFQEAKDFTRLKDYWERFGTATHTVDSPQFAASLRELLPIDRTAWRSDSGTYDRRILFRDTHQVQAEFSGSTLNSKCLWAIEGHEAKESSCAQSPVMDVPARKPFVIVVTDPKTGQRQFPIPAIQERLVVALGDSFASGEGNPDHPTIFSSKTGASQDWYARPETAASFIREDARWWDESCHRSLLSWPALAAFQQAVSARHEVVQFASFACSGAEVYDGLLRAQLNPPGEHGRNTIKSNNGPRDGGLGYRYLASQGDFIEPEKHKTRVRLSQQHALANLLCDDGSVGVMQLVQLPKVEHGVRADQNYFGQFDVYGCTGSKRRVDQVLMSVGGNDVGFSGIVKWLLTATTTRDTLRRRVGLSDWGLGFVRKKMMIVTPEQARSGIEALPRIYSVLSDVLDSLGIPSQAVVLLRYPDPSAGSTSYAICNPRTRDGNRPMQVLLKEKIGNSKFLFGINRSEYSTLAKQFITPLQLVQDRASTARGWSIVDSQPALTTADGVGRGYCSMAPSCGSAACSSGDRVRFWTHPKYSPQLPWKALTDFDAYDASRSRGFRYGVDALLASAARVPDGEGIRSDWFYGSAHPTANVHARIADLVRR